MSDHNPEPMNKEELEKYIEKDFLPSLLSKFPNIPDLVAENARLKAEVERLRSSSFVTAVPVEQYERLVAGGELVLREWSMGNEKGANNYLKALVIWNAAKEGKQP